MSSWEIWLDDPQGIRLKLLGRVMNFQASKIANAAAPFSITLPEGFDSSLLRLDGIVEFWRKPESGRLGLFNLFFIRSIIRQDDANGRELISIAGFDPTYLLSGRIVAYDAGSAQAGMTDQADDMLKAMVVDNLGADATGARNITANGIAVAADLAAAPSITKEFAYRPLLEEMREIAEKSRQDGTELYFDFVPAFGSDGYLDLTFTTYTGQIGADRTSDGGNPLVFGKKWGNLANGYLAEEHNDEVNYVYSGGQGTESARDVQEVSDTERIGQSIWNRREGFAYATDMVTTAGVTSRGEAYLEENRPRREFSANLLDTPFSRYGVDWQFGDRVTAEYGGMEFDCMVNAVVFMVDETGQETLEARAEVEF